MLISNVISFICNWGWQSAILCNDETNAIIPVWVPPPHYPRSSDIRRLGPTHYETHCLLLKIDKDNGTEHSWQCSGVELFPYSSLPSIINLLINIVTNYLLWIVWVVFAIIICDDLSSTTSRGKLSYYSVIIFNISDNTLVWWENYLFFWIILNKFAVLFHIF